MLTAAAHYTTQLDRIGKRADLQHPRFSGRFCLVQLTGLGKLEKNRQSRADKSSQFTEVEHHPYSRGNRAFEIARDRCARAVISVPWTPLIFRTNW